MRPWGPRSQATESRVGRLSRHVDALKEQVEVPVLGAAEHAEAIREVAGQGRVRLGSGLADRGLVDASELTEAELKELKDSFLDVLLWEGSKFRFFQNQLPDEFYNPGDGVSKVALQTNRFLLEAMQLVTEYEAICEVIGGPRTIYQFARADGKLEAIQALGQPEILTLLDGRLSFDDLVRISGAQRLDVGRVIRGLVEEGSLEKTGEKSDPQDAIPDAVMD